MEQVITIKKVTVNEDRHVQFIAEFPGGNPSAQNNLFELIALQGEGVKAILTRSHAELGDSSQT